MPRATLAGLVDPDLPPLAAEARACLDLVHGNAYAGALDRPACFVQLAADRQDPLFAARLLLDPAIPSAAVAAIPSAAVAAIPSAAVAAIPSVAIAPAPDRTRGLAQAVRRYWLARTSRVLPAGALWEWVAACAPATGRHPRPLLAVLTGSPQAPLCAGMRAVAGAQVFGAARLPLLSPRFGRVLFVLANRPEDAALLRLLRRHGGAALLTDSCLLACYADDPAKAACLAGDELARAVPPDEMRQWQLGIARPGALMLGDVAAAAATLIVHSAWLASEIKTRFGREALVVPAAAPVPERPAPAPGIRADAAGLAAESCIWALELLRFWGVEPRLELACAPADHAALAALASRLGVAVQFGPGPAPAALRLFLAMRGQASFTASLAEAAIGGERCIASRAVAEAVDVPDWVQLLPDQPSPPLLAEAILEALQRPPPSGAALQPHRRRQDPHAAAAGLCAALGIAA